MYIHVKVETQSKKYLLIKKSEDHFELSVKEKAERNMANKKIIEMISEYFKLPLNNIRIINGHRSASKLLVVDDVS